jgi:hypothetical protein
MSWLKVSDTNILVDGYAYILAQPIKYHQIEDIIDDVKFSGKSYDVLIDITHVSLYDVNIIGMINIIWEIHDNTAGDKTLRSLRFRGMSDRLSTVWLKVLPNLPSFISQIATP